MVAAGVTLVLRPETFGPPDGGDLASSLDRVGGHMAVPDACEHIRDDRWRCVVEDDPGSGPSGEYRLTLGPDRCWSGQRPMRRRADRLPLKGCIDFWDVVGQ